MQNIPFLVALWLVQKLADAVADKALEKVLSDENLQHWATFLKRQLLAFYFAWQLHATPKQKLNPTVRDRRAIGQMLPPIPDTMLETEEW